MPDMEEVILFDDFLLHFSHYLSFMVMLASFVVKTSFFFFALRIVSFAQLGLSFKYPGVESA